MLRFFSVPLLFVLICTIVLFIKSSQWRRAASYALAAFVLYIGLGAIAIFQSRSSTAGIGFLFLPMIAMIPGVIGLALGKMHSTYLEKKQNGTGLLGYKGGLLVLSILVVVPYIVQIYFMQQTIRKNIARDNEHARQIAAIDAYTRKLHGMLAKNTGNEVKILVEEASVSQDRTRLLPIAGSRYASADLLDKLAQSLDYGVMLKVIRNPNVQASTLQWIYENGSPRSYFYVDLASSPNTPVAILRAIYEERSKNYGITPSLAKNPGTPGDILSKLAREPNKRVLQRLLDRPDLHCSYLDNVGVTIDRLAASDARGLNKQLQARRRNCNK